MIEIARKYSGTPPYGYAIEVVENSSVHLLDFDWLLLPLFITWCYNHGNINFLKTQDERDRYVQSLFKFGKGCFLIMLSTKSW